MLRYELVGSEVGIIMRHVWECRVEPWLPKYHEIGTPILTFTPIQRHMANFTFRWGKFVTAACSCGEALLSFLCWSKLKRICLDFYATYYVHHLLLALIPVGRPAKLAFLGLAALQAILKIPGYWKPGMCWDFSLAQMVLIVETFHSKCLLDLA